MSWKKKHNFGSYRVWKILSDCLIFNNVAIMRISRYGDAFFNLTRCRNIVDNYIIIILFLKIPI